MGIGVKILVGVILALLFAAVYPAMYLASLNMVEVEDVQFLELTIDEQGIAFRGTVVLDNPGLVAVTVDQIRYRIILENTGEELGRGTIDGSGITAGDEAELPFTNVLDWRPNMATAQDLLKNRVLLIRIEGDASAKFLGMTFTKPFQFTLDIHPYLEEYVQELMRDPNALKELAAAYGFTP